MACLPRSTCPVRALPADSCPSPRPANWSATGQPPKGRAEQSKSVFSRQTAPSTGTKRRPATRPVPSVRRPQTWHRDWRYRDTQQSWQRRAAPTPAPAGTYCRRRPAAPTAQIAPAPHASRDGSQKATQQPGSRRIKDQPRLTRAEVRILHPMRIGDARYARLVPPPSRRAGGSRNRGRTNCRGPPAFPSPARPCRQSVGFEVGRKTSTEDIPWGG